MIAAAFALAFASLAVASPVELNQRSKHVERQSFSDDKDAFCQAPRSTPEEAQELWQRSDAWIVLDDYVRIYTNPDSDEPDPEDWLRKMVQDYFPNGGDEGVDSCANIDASEGCEPAGELDCGEWFDEHENVFDRSAYWIFTAAGKTYQKFRILKETIIEETVFTSLDIGKMIEELGGDDSTDSDSFGFLAAAFTMINGITSAIPGPGAKAIAAGAGVMGGMFSAAATAASDEGVQVSDISSGLSEIERRTTEVLKTTLRAAMGKAEDPSDYDKLPVPSWDTLTTRIGKFFNGGFWLLDNDSDTVFEALEVVRKGVQSVTADLIMKNAEYNLVADKREESREECGYSIGRQWMELRDDEEYCFYLAKRPGNSGDWVEADEDIYESLANYGLGERYSYYRAILDCALSDKEEKKPDLNSLPIGGVPECIFNMDAVFLDTGSGPGSCDPFANSCPNWDVTDIE